MKKTLNITTAVAAALSVTVAGCGAPAQDYDDDDDIDWRKRSACVDKRSNKRVDEKYCRSGGGYYGMFFFRNGQKVPAYGTSIPRSYGSYNKTSVMSSYPKSTVSRGGFGSSAKSYGSVSS